jgi:molecular chaperone DnaK
MPLKMADPVIGIDLGTTNSVVASVDDGRPQVILNRDGGRLTPSMVGFLSSGERVVGERARLLAEDEPEAVAFAAKRFIGRRWTPDMAAAARQSLPYPVLGGPSGETRIKVGGRTLPVTQISAMVLCELRLDAVAHFGKPVQRAVITVPANFNDAQRTATKEAARIAGLEVLRLLNEPTAAALAYGLGKEFEGRAIVFDLGGGTFDVSVLEIQKGVYEVKATGGDPFLGGEDFDNRIVRWLMAQLPEGIREVIGRDRHSLQRLKVAAERAKKELSTKDDATLLLDDLGLHGGGETRNPTRLDAVLGRKEFESLCAPLAERCVSVCEQLMKEAAIAPQSVDTVLLVGGMTRVPMIRRLVSEYFGKDPVKNINPDEVVALGAAIHAQEVAEQSGKALLIDVTAHPLGVGVLGGKVRHLVQRNTVIPITARETFLPGHAGQTQARIAIYEGESEWCDENHKLGEVLLSDLTVNDRAELPIEVTFEIASDGTLSVRAIDLTTGMAEALRIEARTELSKAEEDRLAREEAVYASERQAKDAKEVGPRFLRLLERSEKLARMLEQSAKENPSAEAHDAVAAVKMLIDLGRAAFRAGDVEQMAQVRKKLLKLQR